MKGKVLLAMSGGLDSSIAALLLKNQGYDIIGITMKTWDYSQTGLEIKETSCCNIESVNDARNIAIKLDFPHYTLDLTKEFEDIVVNNFVSEYLKGRTPNPCILCNKYFKWDFLLAKASQLGCDYIATGHYSKISFDNGRYYITKGNDKEKDQSYVLWSLSQENLKRTLFPLGEYNKNQIRQMAHESAFYEIASKRESYDICFIPDNDYRGFIRRKHPELTNLFDGGNFVDKFEKVLGKHKGYPFYTIGQRKGLNVAAGYPLYVNKIDSSNNKIYLGAKEELANNTLLVKEYNMMKYNNLLDGKQLEVKIRYHDNGSMAQVVEKDNCLTVSFFENVYAITPGQSVVFYEGNDLVGGGIIYE